MSTKPLFSVEESLRLCPPRKVAGAKFVKRVILRRGKTGIVSYPKAFNPRILSAIQSNVQAIRDSFILNGFIHNQPPPAVIVDPNNKGRYIGISGYNRDEAAEMAGWETMIYDVWEFDSDLRMRVFMTIDNHHLTPSTSMTKEDIIKQVLLAIRENEIKNNSTEIKSLVEELAADKSIQERKNIFLNVEKRKGGTDSLRTYHQGKGDNSTENVAISLNLPYAGEGNYEEIGRLGYIFSTKTPKTTLFDAKKLSKTNDWKTVEFIGFIDKPKSSIREQREELSNGFKKFLEADAEFIVYICQKMGFKTDVDSVLKHYPIKQIGFLPQIITKDASKGGRPTEETLVDALGKAIK